MKRIVQILNGLYNTYLQVTAFMYYLFLHAMLQFMHAKMAMPYSQRYPWYLYLINIAEDILFFSFLVTLIVPLTQLLMSIKFNSCVP